MPVSEIKRLAHEAGFDLVGVCSATEPFAGAQFNQSWLGEAHHAGMDYLVRQAELRQSLDNVLPGARSAIVVGLNYAQPNPPKPGSPRIARYALGRDYHRVMRRRLSQIARELQYQHPEATFRACVDSAPVFERELANRAGLGWFGKNTMLINSQRGSWFLLGTLLTDLELETDVPAVGGCGTCRACIEACPTGAIVQQAGVWQIDSNRCVSYWTIEHKGEIPRELSQKFQDWTFGCDICQEVCPFNTERESQPLRARNTQDPDFLSSSAEPSLIEILNMTQGEFDAWTQGRAIRRAGLEGWKRNARISLENAQNGIL